MIFFAECAFPCFCGLVRAIFDVVILRAVSARLRLFTTLSGVSIALALKALIDSRIWDKAFAILQFSLVKKALINNRIRDFYIGREE